MPALRQALLFRARLLLVVLVALTAGFCMLLRRSALGAAGFGTLAGGLFRAARGGGGSLLVATAFLIRSHFAFLSMEWGTRAGAACASFRETRCVACSMVSRMRFRL